MTKFLISCLWPKIVIIDFLCEIIPNQMNLKYVVLFRTFFWPIPSTKLVTIVLQSWKHYNNHTAYHKNINIFGVPVIKPTVIWPCVIWPYCIFRLEFLVKNWEDCVRQHSIDKTAKLKSTSEEKREDNLKSTRLHFSEVRPSLKSTYWYLGN